MLIQNEFNNYYSIYILHFETNPSNTNTGHDQIETSRSFASILASHVCSGVVSGFSAAHLNASAARRRNKRAAHSLPREWRRRRLAQRAGGPIRAEPRCSPSSPRSCCGWTEHSSFLGLRQQRTAATTRNEPKTRRFQPAHDTFEGHVRLFIKVFFKHSFKMFLKFVVLTRFKRRWCFLSQVWGTGWRVKGSSSGSRVK